MSATPEPLLLSAESVEAIARRVVELQRGEPSSTDADLLTADEVARRLGVTRGWVYDHAAELGRVKLGDGPRARLRFPAAAIAERLEGAPASARADDRSERPAPGGQRRRRSQLPRNDLLPIRGERG